MSAMAPSTSAGLYARRRIVNVLALVLSCATALFGLFFLGWILWTLLAKGIPGINWSLFTQMTPPPMQEGGLTQRILRQRGDVRAGDRDRHPARHRGGHLTGRVRQCAQGRNGGALRQRHPAVGAVHCPGLFVYTLYVMQTGGNFSAFAGALALAFIVLPVVVRTTDEMLRLVPVQMREAALSLGIPQWKVIVQVLYRSASAGIVTGVLLSP